MKRIIQNRNFIKMKTAFDRPCVQHTKAEVILYKGKIVGKIITGISNNYSGATSTLEIKEDKIPFQPKGKISISKTMAGGGMDFANETKYLCYLCLLELIQITDNEEFVKKKLKEGVTLKNVFKTYFKITFETIL